MIFEQVGLSVLAFILGATFFIVEYYGQRISNIPTIPVSFVGGISITYFFLVLLPEISKNLPEYPLQLTLFEYLFVLIGFTFIHVTEKLILQRVESKTQHKVRTLMRKERDLELVEDKIENYLNQELSREKADESAIRELSSVISRLHQKKLSIESEINNSKQKIHDHMNEEFEKFKFFTKFFYHFLIGLILFNLISVELIPAILFYLFAFFRVVIATDMSPEKNKLFTDLDIELDYQETKLNRILLSSSPLIGMFFDLGFDLIYPINLEVLYLMFSFISGVILYSIVREVLPQKEKGNPLFFLLGVVGFAITVFVMNLFVSLI
jgi:zinc transporter ZupT